MNIIKILLLLLYLDYSNTFLLQNIFMERRNVIANSIFTQSYIEYKKQKNIDKKQIDHYAHWSMYGLVAPPIEKTISKEDLINEIGKKNIISLQIAVQHDCVIATNRENHRLSLFIKDKDFNEFVNQFREKDNSLPFRVIPIDENQQKIRTFAQFWLGLYSIRFVAYEIPNNIRLLNECNSSMTTRQKMLYLLESQNDILKVLRNSTKD